MKSLFNKKCGAVSALIATLLLLSGCNSLQSVMSGDDAIDYKSVVRTDPLSIPPDLTQAANDPRYRSPATGTTTFSQFQQAQTGGRSVQRSPAVLITASGLQGEEPLVDRRM